MLYLPAASPSPHISTGHRGANAMAREGYVALVSGAAYMPAGGLFPRRCESFGGVTE